MICSTSPTPAQARSLVSRGPCRAFKWRVGARFAESTHPRAPPRAAAGGAASRPRRARAHRERRCGAHAHRRPKAAIGVAAARPPRTPLSVGTPQPAQSARGTVRISGAACDPGQVAGRRNRTVAPATRPGHHRAARLCRRARPEVPHGPERRPRREAAMRARNHAPTGRRVRPLTFRKETAPSNINLIIIVLNEGKYPAYACEEQHVAL